MKEPIVVITSIYPPGEAVQKIAEKHQLIVAGDKKTPQNWQYQNVRYISVDEQLKLPYRLIEKLPFNHYSRKMVAYLEAMSSNADVIIDTDDDNIPKGGLIFPDFEGTYAVTDLDKGFVNVYSYFSDQHIWPRGLPLDRIATKIEQKEKNNMAVGIWQGLADGDPDVDAIYRLTINKPCIFKEREPVVLEKGTLSPFNSQNTAFRRELFPLLYLPAHVTFRFTDILRGWVAQPIMWSAGYSLGFSQATVIQERNPHDYLKDFESEIPCYLMGDRVIETVLGSVKSSNTIADNLRLSYEALHKIDVVPKEELILLDMWLQDLTQINAN